MTPQQIWLVQSSFKSVAPIASKAAALFYDRLFVIAPEVRQLFPAKLSEQKIKLMAMLTKTQQSPSARCHFASCTPTRRAAQGLRCLGGSLWVSGCCPALDARAGSWLSVHSGGESCLV